MFVDGYCSATCSCNVGSAAGEACASGAAREPPAGADTNLDAYSIEWDFVIGSDLVYNQDGTDLLPKVLARLTSSKTCVLYCHTKRRFEHMDYDFLEGLGREGLAYVEVREPWAPSPSTSPDAFTELYPDMRIAVYRITRAGQEVPDVM